MRDVAKMADVSTMTVSRVLKGNVFVGEETRVRVLDAVAKLNYLPNEVARSLREQRTRQIGIIVPNLHDPFFAICSQAITLVAREHAYSTVITTSDEDAAAEFDEARRMLRRHIEGLLIIPATGKSHLLDPELARTPIVTLDRPVAKSSFGCVVVENKRGAKMGVQHLIDHGHRRIAFLGRSLQLWTMKERAEGYNQAMHSASLKPEVHVVTESQQETLEILQQILAIKHPPTAFFCGNNFIMRNVLHALSLIDVRIPQQIALVGFDDFDMADIVKPAITVVRQPTEAMGRIAAELLFARLTSGEQSNKPQRIVLPVELVVRQSCGSHAA